jgi:hypothetical protein
LLLALICRFCLCVFGRVLSPTACLCCPCALLLLLRFAPVCSCAHTRSDGAQDEEGESKERKVELKDGKEKPKTGSAAPGSAAAGAAPAKAATTAGGAAGAAPAKAPARAGNLNLPPFLRWANPSMSDALTI